LSWDDVAAKLTWQHYHQGDYDQNGEVNSADMVRIAAHFGQTSANPNWQSVIDGDDNGVINISDLTPIALMFKTESASYNIYQSTTGSGPWNKIGSVAFSTYLGDPVHERIWFEYNPAHFAGAWYYVIHVDPAGVEGAMSNIISTPAPLAPDTLYAIPVQQSVAVGEPVTIRVATGQPAHSLVYLNSVALTIETAGTYVPNSYNIGEVGGARLDTDGYWALMMPPPANGNFLDGGDGICPGPPVDIGGGFQRYVINITPLGGPAAPASIGDGAVLYNLQLTFSAAGTYHLGFQLFEGVDRTYYSDQTSTTYYWSTLDSSNTITVN
jgi:hypothetical protein